MELHPCKFKNKQSWLSWGTGRRPMWLGIREWVRQKEGKPRRDHAGFWDEVREAGFKKDDWRKVYNLKVVELLYFRTWLRTEDNSPGDSCSDSSEELLQIGKGGLWICRNFCWKKKKKTHVVKHQNTTANHKKQPSQVNDFSTFLCMGGCESLGSLKSFLRYAS